MKSGPGGGDELRGLQLPMNWSLLRRDCEDLFARYGWRLTIGTFDAAIVASARLAGATCFLSFDLTAKTRV